MVKEYFKKGFGVTLGVYAAAFVMSLVGLILAVIVWLVFGAALLGLVAVGNQALAQETPSAFVQEAPVAESTAVPTETPEAMSCTDRAVATMWAISDPFSTAYQNAAEDYNACP